MTKALLNAFAAVGAYMSLVARQVDGVAPPENFSCLLHLASEPHGAGNQTVVFQIIFSRELGMAAILAHIRLTLNTLSMQWVMHCRCLS